jgi:hypothetical protein
MVYGASPTATAPVDVDSEPVVALLYVKDVDVGVDVTIAVPLNPMGTSPEITTDCPITTPVAVDVVQVTTLDAIVAVNEVELVGHRLLPISRLFDPVIPYPDADPMIMFEEPVDDVPFDVPRYTLHDPAPRVLPPMLIVFDTFDKPTEFDVPIKTLLAMLDALFAEAPTPAANAPPTKVLVMNLALLPHKYPMNSEFDALEMPAPAEFPILVL